MAGTHHPARVQPLAGPARRGEHERVTQERDLGLLDALFATAPIGMAVLGTDLRIERVNDVLAQMNGRAVDEHVGLTIAEVLPDLPPEAARIPEQVLRTGRPVVGLEVIGRTPADPDREHIWLDSCFRIDGSDGQPLGVGVLVADVTAERLAERIRAAQEVRMGLLARASEVLSASLDPEVTVEHLCDLMVPALADHAFVDLAHEGGRFRRVGIRHAPGIPVDPALVRPVGELSRYAADHPIAQALATGQVVRIQDATRAAVPATEDVRFLRALGVSSVLIVPMVVAGRAVGVATLCHSASRRQYEEEDAALVTQLVSRAAIAVANAMSYERQRHAAEELQRHLLPTNFDRIEGLEVAWRYVPGTFDTEVGGDWVDVLELSPGRVAVVIGDVMGRGMRAAAVMGQLRTAVRVLADQDLPPGDVLERLDSIVSGIGEGQFVTCVYAVYDRGRDVLTLANAGHLPPIRVEDGQAAQVEAEVNMPLGVGGERFRSVEVPLPPGAALALYTDGVVEAPGSDVDVGIERVRTSLLAAGPDIEQMCDRVLRESLPGHRGLEDDAAVLVVRAAERAQDDVVSAWFPNTPRSVAEARGVLRRALTRWGLLGDERLHAVGELLVSELTTNAVRHTTGSISLLIRLGRSALVIEVTDEDTRLPRLRHPDLLDEDGRGLALVQSMATRWGSRPTLTGKVVWFSLDRAEGEAADATGRGRR